MPLNGNELQINSKKYLMQLIDGNLFYLGRLLDKKRRLTLRTQPDDMQNYIFVFEHNPPINKCFYMPLWNHYKIFMETDSLDDRDEFVL